MRPPATVTSQSCAAGTDRIVGGAQEPGPARKMAGAVGIGGQPGGKHRVGKADRSSRGKHHTKFEPRKIVESSLFFETNELN